MFKFRSKDLTQEESVYKFFEKENGNGEGSEFPDRKGRSRYRSIHSAMVRDESSKNKAWATKTMGVPEVHLNGPEHFLKKQSKRPLSMRSKSVSLSNLLPRDKSCQTGEEDEYNWETEQKLCGDSSRSMKDVRPKTCRQRMCSARKPPIPDPKQGIQYVIEENKDFVHSNALSAIRSTPKNKPKEPVVYVDTPKGDTQRWENSGLAPRYTLQKKFAHVPVYITARKQEFFDELKKKEEEDIKNRENSKVRLLDANEKETLIIGLKSNWQEIFSFYQKLPLQIDTPGKIKRKTKMEEQLKKLETDIQMLQRHEMIYVSDLAPRSFYAGQRKT